MAKYAEINREQLFLFPPDIRDMIAPNDEVRFLAEAFKRISLEEFGIKISDAQPCPVPINSILALLIYCYASGIFSSHKIEELTRNNVRYRYLTENAPLDSDTICAFRQENKDGIIECFVLVLAIASDIGLPGLGDVKIGDSKLNSDVERPKNRGEKISLASRKKYLPVAEELLTLAEKTDAETGEDIGGLFVEKLPEDLTGKDRIRERLDAVFEELYGDTKEKAGKLSVAVNQVQTANHNSQQMFDFST